MKLMKYDCGNIKAFFSVFASLCVFPLLVVRYAGDQTYFDEIKQFYYRDEFSHQVQEWNRQRTLAIERALTQFLYPQMAKELKSKLITEAKESIIRVSSVSIYCNITTSQLCYAGQSNTVNTCIMSILLLVV